MENLINKTNLNSHPRAAVVATKTGAGFFIWFDDEKGIRNGKRKNRDTGDSR
jgi:hypothetical protein